MGKPTIDMPKLPESVFLQEYPAAMIHGAGHYKLYIDGLDCYICESTNEGHGTLKFLVKSSGSELTERLGIALLRAAAIQRNAEAARSN